MSKLSRPKLWKNAARVRSGASVEPTAHKDAPYSTTHGLEFVRRSIRRCLLGCSLPLICRKEQYLTKKFLFVSRTAQSFHLDKRII